MGQVGGPGEVRTVSDRYNQHILLLLSWKTCWRHQDLESKIKALYRKTDLVQLQANYLSNLELALFVNFFFSAWIKVMKCECGRYVQRVL